jgi:hypothetical protein
MKNNNVVIMIIVALLIGGGGFFAGMKYQQSKTAQTFAGRFGGPNSSGGRNRFGGNSNNRPVMGDIISQDDKSITVKMLDGSSKIVLISDSTSISKSDSGSKTDLKVGTRVGVFGTTNSDGSVTAQNVQLNPMFRGPGSSPAASATSNQ